MKLRNSTIYLFITIWVTATSFYLMIQTPHVENQQSEDKVLLTHNSTSPDEFYEPPEITQQTIDQLTSSLYQKSSMENTVKTPPPNQEYLEYLQKKLSDEDDSEDNFGLAPTPYLLSSSNSVGDINSQVAPEVYSAESSFDLRSLTDKMPAVRDQNPAGSCWTFATYGSLETSIRPSDTSDFSENHMKNTHGFDLAHDEGGNNYMSMAYLARWGGAVSEADDPYNPISGVSPPDLSPVRHVQEMWDVPNNDPAIIKTMIQSYGGLFTNYYHSDSYYNSANAAYYYSGALQSNHAVTIVGWDDNYPSTNFLAGKQPPANGAWLVRNSWGSAWGIGGYFYVSYSDTNFAKNGSVLFPSAEGVENYQEVDSYNPLGLVTQLNVSHGASIFSTDGEAKAINAVGIYPSEPNTDYIIKIYKNPTANNPESGSLAATKSGTALYSGYITVPLDTPVDLSVSDATYSVVLTMSGGSYPMAAEYAVAGYSSAASSAPGRSFYSENGSSWVDLTSWDSTADIAVNVYLDGIVDPSNSPPVLENIGAKSIDEGATLAFQISATDADADELTYMASYLPPGASFDPATRNFSWTPSFQQAGTYDDIQFSVSDGMASDSEIITVTVNNINAPPVLSAIGNKSVAENSSLSFTISASDADGDSLSYSASNMPVGATFDTALKTFSWTPDYEQSGDYDLVRFEVSDGLVQDYEEITITVTNVNRPPVFQSVGSMSVNENSLLEFSVLATDGDEEEITYSAANLPSGASFNSTSRIFSWTPSYLQAGNYKVTFVARDNTIEVPMVVSISVINVPQEPHGNDTSPVSLRTYASIYTFSGLKTSDCRAFYGNGVLADYPLTSWQASITLSPGLNNYDIIYRNIFDQEIARKPVSISLNRLADINGDSRVDLLDLSILANYWEHTNPGEPLSDLNSDGVVDLMDLSVFANNWTD